MRLVPWSFAGEQADATLSCEKEKQLIDSLEIKKKSLKKSKYICG